MKNLKIVIAQDGYATTMEIEIFRLHHIAKHKYEEVTRVQRETCMAGGACLTERVLRLKTWRVRPQGSAEGGIELITTVPLGVSGRFRPHGNSPTLHVWRQRIPNGHDVGQRTIRKPLGKYCRPANLHDIEVLMVKQQRRRVSYMVPVERHHNTTVASISQQTKNCHWRRNELTPAVLNRVVHAWWISNGDMELHCDLHYLEGIRLSLTGIHVQLVQGHLRKGLCRHADDRKRRPTAKVVVERTRTVAQNSFTGHGRYHFVAGKDTNKVGIWQLRHFLYIPTDLVRWVVGCSKGNICWQYCGLYCCFGVVEGGQQRNVVF